MNKAANKARIIQRLTFKLEGNRVKTGFAVLAGCNFVDKYSPDVIFQTNKKELVEKLADSLCNQTKKDEIISSKIREHFIETGLVQPKV